MITILPFGPLQSNMYILSNSNGYIIIDPCVGVDLTTSYLSSFSVEKVKAVIMTHAHFDHLMYVDEWRSALHDDVPFYLSHEDVPLLKDANLNRSQNRGLSQEYVVETLDVCHMDSKLFLDEYYCQVLNTPGHTKGSVCYCFSSKNNTCKPMMFTGVTIFCDSIGRTDLPTGSYMQMRDSIRLIKSLIGDYDIFPGHGESTCLSQQKQTNPFFI